MAAAVFPKRLAEMLIEFACLAMLAAANGANDVSRAAATLLGGRVAIYSRAMRWTVAFTFTGSLLSGWLASGVARRFANVLGDDPAHLTVAIPAVLLGASLWIGLATWARLPVATTHALVGCLLGVTWVGGGWAACHRIDLQKGFILPLLASPVLACVGSIFLMLVQRKIPCPPIAWIVWMDRLHWLSAGLTALSRGVNDSAKIWAILLPVSIFLGSQPAYLVHLTQITVAFAMLGGAVLAGRRVTETLAFGIVPLSSLEGTTANLVTAVVIIGASLLSFPVASSHVVSGAIFGVGITGHRGLLRWHTLVATASAWVLTLPSCTLIAVVLSLIFRHMRGTAVGYPAMYLISAVLLAISLLRKKKPLVGAPLANRLIIFVCNSNTSRSPMAAHICTALLARIQLDARVTVLSRGISATEGQPLAPFAAEALKEIRVPVPSHAAMNLDDETVSKADLIFCMTDEQVQVLIQSFPAAAHKIIPLDLHKNIPNPAGQDRIVFQNVATAIRRGLDARLNLIVGT